MFRSFEAKRKNQRCCQQKKKNPRREVNLLPIQPAAIFANWNKAWRHRDDFVFGIHFSIKVRAFDFVYWTLV